jgi:signal transduction histidine kinase
MELQAERGQELKSPERLKTIRSEADRLGEIVTKLMDYTYGKQDKAAFTPIECSELLKRAGAILKPVCMKRSNEFITDEHSTGRLYGNFELLLQVIINLVVNASKHTENGRISVTTADEGAFTVFTVTDTGTGIAPEYVPHIFERGFTKDGGTGLGLAICSESIALHGGKIELVKTGPEGSVFAFTVPKDRT